MAKLTQYPYISASAPMTILGADPAQAPASAVTVTLTVTPGSPAHGATLTAAYVVSGNADAPGTPVAISGSVTIGAVQFPVNTAFTMPGSPAAAVTYAVPTAAGLTFSPTSNPAVFTAVVP